MCGIVGYITLETYANKPQRDKFLTHALMLDTLRGKDSTGVYCVTNTSNRPAGVEKAVLPGTDFIHTKEYDDFLRAETKEGRTVRAMVGHNRAATIGKVSHTNAHPFVSGPITLVHNGSLWGAENLPTPQEACKVDVDSHALAINLHRHSVEEVTKNIDGAFALVWHDSRDDSINIIRNSERPFHMAMAKDNRTVFFMSEASMLRAILDHNKIDHHPIFYPKPGMHLRYTPGSLTPQITQMTLSERTRWSDDEWYPVNGTWMRRQRPTRTVTGGYVLGTPPREPAPSKARESTKGYVFVNGRQQPVPQLLQEELLEQEFVTEDVLEFEPHGQGLVNANGMGSVSGILPDGSTGVIWSISASSFTTYKKHTWKVQPIAPYYTSSDDKNPIIVCKLLSYVEPDWAVKPRRPAKDTPTNSSVTELYPVGLGQIGTATTFFRATASGCVTCGYMFKLDEARDILWVNGGKDPLCQACAEDLSRNTCSVGGH